MSRWWNEGRYERECAEFDARHPLSRQLWDSLRAIHRERIIRESMQPLEPFTPPLSDADETEGFYCRARFWYTFGGGYNGVFPIE